MNCPKCKSRMENIAVEGIGVVRCTNCQGMWFELLGIERLAKKKAAAQLDTGAVEVGLKYNKIREIDCPKCNTRMTKMSDKDMPELAYEKCPVCYGVWLDAGEFRQYRRRGWLHSFKRLFRRPASSTGLDDQTL